MFDAVPGLIDYDNNDVVSSLSVIPNEIVAYIIHLVLISDLTMLGTINHARDFARQWSGMSIARFLGREYAVVGEWIMMPESFCWYRIIDIFWRRKRYNSDVQ